MKSDIVVGADDEINADSLLEQAENADGDSDGLSQAADSLVNLQTIAVMFVATLIAASAIWLVRGAVIGWILWFLGGVVTIYGARRLWRSSFVNLRRKELSTDYLLILATAGYYILGTLGLARGQEWAIYLFDAVFLVFASLVSRFVQDVIKRKINIHLELLTGACEGRILVKRGGHLKEINADTLRPGDFVVGESGSSVVADGVVIRGDGEVSEVIFHKERSVVPKAPGDLIFAGSRVQSGRLEYQVTSIGRDTLVQKIVALVRRAQDHEGRLRSFARRSGLWSMLIVLALAVVVAAIGLVRHRSIDDIGVATLLLLVSLAPCLWEVAFESVGMALTSYGLNVGLVVRDPEIALTMLRLKTIVFDKTGTVSEGKPRVVNIIPISKGTSVDWVLKTVAAIEARSDHPISEAVLRKWQRQIREANAFEEISGMGIRGIVEGKRMILGNLGFMREYNIGFGQATTERIRQLEASGKTLLFLARENTHLSGIVVLEDALRPTSFEAVGKLKDIGLKTVLVTGDNVSIGNMAGQEIGADEPSGGLLPKDKVKVIEKLKNEAGPVLALGSGQSDQAMIGHADIGVSNVTGCEIADRRGQVIMLNGRLSDAVELIKRGRSAALGGGQNLIWAYLFNISLVAMALVRALPTEAVIAAAAAAPLVPYLNSLRIRK